MQVYELLANHNLYLQTEQTIGRHPFQLVYRVAPERRTVTFELQAMPVEPNGITASDAIDALMGLYRYQLVNAANDLYLPFEFWNNFAAFGLNLYHVFQLHDATYISVNASFDMADAVTIHHATVVVDERASFRHPSLVAFDQTALHMAGIHGTVVCIGSGAGLVMMTADALDRLVMDAPLRIHALAEIEEAHLMTRLHGVLSRAAETPNTHVIVVTIYTTFVDCDAIAQMLAEFAQVTPAVPVIAHLEGIGAESAAHTLRNAGVVAVHGLAQIAHAVQVTTGAGTQS